MKTISKKVTRRRHRRANGTPWLRGFTNTWMVTLTPGEKPVTLRTEDGAPIKGTENEAAAKDALARLRLGLQSAAPADMWTVARACEAYIDFAKGEKYANVETTEKLLRDWCGYAGGLPIAQLTKSHLRQWINSHAGWKSDQTKRNAATVVSAALGYVGAEGKGPSNPLAGYKKEKEVTRVALAFTAEQERAILAVANKHFTAFFKMLILTGCRPSELAGITRERIKRDEIGRMYFEIPAKNADGSFAHKTARKTGEVRTILVGPAAEKIVNQAMATAPEGGPIFRTPRGKLWTKKNCRQTFAPIAKKLGLPKGLVLYVCRHTFAKRLLHGETTGQPVPIGVVAALLGNSEKICRKHYAKWLGTEEPLWAAVGGKKTEAVEAGDGVAA